jgi:immunity protein Imm1 of predicted polymorphic toxin system
MKKRAYFDTYWGKGWPALDWLRPYFLAPSGQRWFFDSGNDSAGIDLEGVEGTEHLELGKGRVDIHLAMWGHPQHGVLIIYSKRGGGYREDYTSKGDLTRLRELVRSLHDTPLPVGLFIPFEQAWKAVKEFIETEGKLPTSIEWIANRDLPPNTFPDP